MYFFGQHKSWHHIWNYTDFITNAHQSSFVLMAALLHRRRTGEGQYIDLSQIEAVINNTGTMMLDYTANGRIMDRLGNRDELAAPHGIYQCRGDEQWCAIAVFSQEDWERLAGIMGRPELINDSRFSTLEDRKANEDTLDEIVEEWTSQLDAQELTVLLQEAGVPAGAVQNAREVMEDPQIIARNHFRRVVHFLTMFLAVMKGQRRKVIGLALGEGSYRGRIQRAGQ